MSVAIVLKVFENSTLITDRGEFKISRVFPDHRSAQKANYHFYTAMNGVNIYRRTAKSGLVTYAYVGK